MRREKDLLCHRCPGLKFVARSIGNERNTQHTSRQNRQIIFARR